MKGFIRHLRQSIRGRLVLLVAGVTVPALLLAAALTWQAYRNERGAVARHVLGTARALASLVDRQIGESEAVLRGLALSAALQAGDLAGFDPLARAAASSGDDRWIVLRDMEGYQLVNTSLPPGAALPKTVYSERLLADMAADRTYVSGLAVSQVSGHNILYLTVPVRRGGRLVYTLSLVMRPSAFARALNVDGFFPSATVAIVDQRGAIAARNVGADQWVGRSATADVMAAAQSRREGLMPSVTLDRTAVLAAYSPARASGWTVVIGAPDAQLFASARRLLGLGLMLSAALGVVAVLFAAWISRGLLSGINLLVEDTETIGQGRTPERRSSGLIETDFVADAMIRTAAQLRAREEENVRLNHAIQEELAKQMESDAAVRWLAAIVENSDDAIVSKDLNGVVSSWNKSAERIFGYRAEEIVGRSITLILPPDRQDEEPRILSRIRAGEHVDHFETVRRRRDGSLVPVSVSVAPLRDRSGRIVGASKIARDISQRRRTEVQQQILYELVAEVNRAEALPEISRTALRALRSCVDAERVAISLIDANGTMQVVAAHNLSEHYQAAAEGHSPWPVDGAEFEPVWFDDVAAASLEPSLRAAMEAEGIRAAAFAAIAFEHRLLGKFALYHDRPHRFTRDELRPVETITRQLAFALERQRSAQALETLVDERTASLRAAVEQMEEFSYSVSHDLRAPVRAMRGYAEALLEDYGAQLDEAGRSMLQRIVASGGRMDRLIQDLLTYSRLSQRTVPLGPVSLDKLVHEVVQQQPAVQGAQIEVQEPLPDVVGHDASLSQVISNLLSNAVKFVAPGTQPRVRIAWEPVGGGRGRLWFEDNGIGIKPEHQGRLFGMFERVHPDRTYEGTGIGLAIVRKAMERMNGRVGVESAGAGGSRFWIELPLASAS